MAWFWRVSRRLRLKAHPDACQDALKAVLESAQPICYVRYLFTGSFTAASIIGGFFVSTNNLANALCLGRGRPLLASRALKYSVRGTDAPVDFKDILYSR